MKHCLVIVFLIINITIVFISAAHANSQDHRSLSKHNQTEQSLSSLSNSYLDELPNDFGKLNFKAVGSAKFSVLFWDIYNSTLYTKSGQYLPSNEYPPNSLIFEIEYLRDISAEDLLKRTIEQWQHLGISKTQYQHYIPLLICIWPDISVGDKLALLVDGQHSIFYFNHLKIGVIEQQDFSTLFLNIWLSPNTSQAKLRAQLLGDKN